MSYETDTVKYLIKTKVKSEKDLNLPAFALEACKKAVDSLSVEQIDRYHRARNVYFNVTSNTIEFEDAST